MVHAVMQFAQRLRAVHVPFAVGAIAGVGVMVGYLRMREQLKPRTDDGQAVCKFVLIGEGKNLCLQYIRIKIKPTFTCKTIIMCTGMVCQRPL